MIGHGQLGLRSGLRSFLDFAEQTQAVKDVYVELRPVMQVLPSTWAVDINSTYVAGFEFIFEGIRRDVVAVRSTNDTGLRRVQTLTECRNTSGTFYYDPDEEFGQTALKWDIVGQTWDASPTMFWDQFPRLFVHLEDNSNPALTTVVASLGFYFSGAGKTSLGDAQVHPALSEDLLLIGSFETWVDNMPSGWTEYGIGLLPFWDDSVSDWDGNDNEFWDPLTIQILKETADFRDGASSIKFATTSGVTRGVYALMSGKFVVAKRYRLSGWYKSTGTAQPAVAVRESDGDTLYVNGRDVQTGNQVRNLDKTAGEWRRFIFDFRASDTSMYILVEGSGDGTVLFDGLRVQRAWRYNWYEPRLTTSSVPAISTGSNDIFFGGKTIGVGSVELINRDGMLERLAAEVEWMNQNVLVDIGGQFTDDEQEILVDDFFRGFTGLVQDIEADDNKFTLGLQDQRVFFHTKLPPKLYDDEDFPTMDVRRQGRPRPVFFGQKENIDPTRISFDASTGYGTYEICDTTDSPNGIKSVDAVYAYAGSNAAEVVSVNERITLGAVADYSVNLTTGRVSILRDIGPYVIDEGNRRMDFDLGGGALVATLTVALYTATDLAVEIQTQMRAIAGVSTIDVAYSNTTHKFTISRPSGTLNLRTSTGANKDRSPWKLIGFTLGGDKTGSTSYTGDNATFTSADKNHLIRVDAKGYIDDSVGTYTGAPLALIEIGADICRVLLVKFMKKPLSIIDVNSFVFARQRASESLAIFLKTSISTKDVFDKLEFSNIANIVVNGEGKVFYKVYVGDIPSDIVDLEDRHFQKFSSGSSNREVFTTVRVKHNEDPTSGQFHARESTDTSVIARLGRPDIKEFETYIRQGDNAILAADRFLELSRTAARKITGETIGSMLLRLEVGDKFRLQRRRAIAKGGIISSEIFRIIKLSKNPLAGRVSFEATDDRVTVASVACVETCQQFCESTCQVGCQQICQGTCEATCQGSCEGSCEVSCEASCQSTCQLGCQTTCQKTCQESCQLSCQAACQGAGCQTACQASCQTACELTCQTACQSSCQGNCQVTCQSGCEVADQTCVITCQTTCKVTCQETCKLNCQVGCEVSCENPCQLNCQTKSETSI